ncbi:MAG: cation:proton antiporter [Cyanobacteria bacterium MAG STY4_bin_9]|mgnify:FL=1|jgi:NhaP-type Na+/H+ or K+/H+ antiporter|uniref:cation:proton antiporter n=1 Tax=unclassified Synechococcus TaxID=2626047 RepID=UPI000AB698CA|nr:MULTISPECIES: cation:proton antiporter [unclassified Synechococcus]MBN89800.1 sodium:proton antiporter [Synechococcus sp. RS344]MCH1545110.1 cation:proton antiporter [Synechococcus sp. MOX_bin32]MCY3847875.1 cation:proton antiporter [Cyanobacteria bacterium MAG COS4_bin_21]MCY4085075.1 cation:proton antiporter [Cyanobacteria bacterium MAG COS1_bin_9]MDC3009752.1 cation:proton antiporter [Synechococcus sp. AH-736-G20]MDD9881677.1 cation:proton antiporter [Cyanobacteria bacterium MAG STY4_bi|tara:strand:- start:1895 stop:3160 length:1266 start_codon:yes stop_codon:yes gene_type:complete
MTPERLGLLWGVTVSSGAAARFLAAKSEFPGVVLLLLSGLLIGRSGLGWVEPLDLGSGLGTVVGLLVSLVLFDGGLNLRLPGDTIKATVQRIAALRLLISLGGGLLAAHWLAGLSWSLAAVFSAIVLATGPTVVTPLVRQIRLAPPLGEVLEAEGLVLEPIGAVLALLLLELVLGNLHGWREVMLGLLYRLGGGVLIGASVGWLLSELLRRLKPDQLKGLPLQLSLGLLFLMYGVSEWLLPESALPASVAAGIVVGRRPGPHTAELDGLIQELAQLAITMLFPLLAADVSWAELSPLGWGGILCVLSLMLVVRPIGVGLATIGLPYKLEQRLFLGWLAPRGIVTAAVASLFAIRLEQAGILGAGRLQGLVFLTILMTVGLQGLTAQPLAQALGLVKAEDDEPASAEAAAQTRQVLTDSGQQ